MNSENMARILQNMIEEAEDNLTYLEKVHGGREHLEARFSDLAEAMALIEELGGPPLTEDKPSVPMAMLEAAADRVIKFENQFTQNLDPAISDAYFSELRAVITGKE